LNKNIPEVRQKWLKLLSMQNALDAKLVSTVALSVYMKSKTANLHQAKKANA